MALYNIKFWRKSNQQKVAPPATKVAWKDNQQAVLMAGILMFEIIF